MQSCNLSDIRNAFDLAYPDSVVRHAILNLLVDTIEEIQKRSPLPWRWAVSFLPSGTTKHTVLLRLNAVTVRTDHPAATTSAVVPIDILTRPNRIEFLVAGPLSVTTEDCIRRVGGLVERSEYGKYRRTQAYEVTIPAEHASALYPLIRDAHVTLIERRPQSSLKTGASARKAHKPELLAYLREQLPERQIRNPDDVVTLFSPSPPPPPPKGILRTGQGPVVDAAKRSAIELQAMELAKKYLCEQGWAEEEVNDVSKDGLHYDLRCCRGNKELRVEVKGTQSDGATVRLTGHEVIHAQNHSSRTALIVVTGITVTPREDGAGFIAKGGVVDGVWYPWSPANDDLRALEYEYRVPSRDTTVSRLSPTDIS